MEETNPPGYDDVSDVDGGDPNTITVTIGGDSPLDSTGNDFVDEVEKLGSISGNVKEDTNDDDIGEVDIPAVTITLEDSTGVTVATTVTDSLPVWWLGSSRLHRGRDEPAGL